MMNHEFSERGPCQGLLLRHPEAEANGEINNVQL